MIEKVVELKNGCREYLTSGINNMGDSISIFKDGNKYTDDGCSAFEFQCAGWDENKYRNVCKNIAEWLFCEFENDEFFVTDGDEKEALTQIFQCQTAASAMICI